MKRRAEETQVHGETNNKPGESYSVFGYIAALFTVMLLLLLLSWFMSERNESSLQFAQYHTGSLVQNEYQ